MAFSIIQAGSSLQLMDASGNLATMALPTNVTISSARVPRFAIFGRYGVIVNSPSRPLSVDTSGIVRVLCPRAPGTIPVLAGAAGGALTGTYLVKQTFKIKDPQGNIIAESDLGPVPTAATITAQYLKVTGLDLSPDDVTSTQLYRTTTGGSTYFPWLEIDGNTQTQTQDDLSDAGLGLASAPTLGTPPDLTLIAEWRGRLWGVDRSLVDNLRFTTSGHMYAWPITNSIPIPKIGSDTRGVTALLKRKDALACGRLNSLTQMSGNNDNSLFKPITVTENCGVISQESVATFVDTTYFLWIDGVYKWDAEGIACISDTGKVRSWFATGNYFNQAQFPAAFGHVNPNTKRYKLFLCSAGSTTIDRWVEYDIISGRWWGPHTTAAFTPSCTLIAPTAANVLVPLVGSAAGYVFKEQATRTDSTATAIDFNVDTKRHDADTPNVVKAWKDLRMTGIAQTTGRLLVTGSVGELNAVTSAQALRCDLTKAQQRVGMFGPGRHITLNLRENTAGQDVELTGYELDFHELGVR